MIPADSFSMDPDDSLEVSVPVREQTEHCRRDFACLKEGEGCGCSLGRALDGPLFYVKPVRKEPCSYKMLFGADAICTCPIRIELRNRYGK